MTLFPLCWMCSTALSQPSGCHGPEHAARLQELSWQSKGSFFSDKSCENGQQQGPDSPSRATCKPWLCASPHLCPGAAVPQLCCTISPLHGSGPHPGGLPWHPGLASDLPCHCSPAGWPYGLCLTLTTVSQPNLGPESLLHILAPC